VNEEGVNDHEGRLRLGSRARRVIGLEGGRASSVCSPAGFAMLLGFMIWCVGEALKGATSATVTAPRCGSSNHTAIPSRSLPNQALRLCAGSTQRRADPAYARSNDDRQVSGFLARR
jgi:hypothetical protein